MNRLVLAGLLVALALPGRAAAQGLVTDRPDFTESALTVPARRVQLEAGVTHAWSGDARELSAGEMLGRIGLLPVLELRLALPSWVRRDDGDASVDGFAEPGVGLKLQLMRGGEGYSYARPDLALIVEATAPPLDDALGEDAWSEGVKLCAAWSPPGSYALAVNLGAERSEAGDGEGTGSASASLGVELAAGFGAYAEWFAFRSLERAETPTQWVDGGVTFAPNDDLQLDVRLGFALHRSEDGFVGAGVSRRW